LEDEGFARASGHWGSVDFRNYVSSLEGATSVLRPRLISALH
jgi:hypothetical protein